MTSTDRKCNDCGKTYAARTGKGGSLASKRDAELFPFNGETGVPADNEGWMHGAFCSNRCYDAAYAE